MQIKLVTLITISLLLAFTFGVSAQELSSTNYKILDPTIDSGGGASDSTNYSILQSLGNPTADARLTSGSYALGSGFPSGIQANVPLVRCAEATTTTASPSLCLYFPNANGAQGECGTPGCYSRIKFEIDHQNNPIDTLYLVSMTDTVTSTVYYVQSTHTLATNYDINDYLTICGHEGRDPRTGSGCVTGGDPQWNATLQRYNVYGLTPGRQYSVAVRALSGDFTETQYSPAVNVTLEYPTLSLDIDTGTLISSNNAGPHVISLGVLVPNTVVTATNRIWLDLGTNILSGLSTYVRDTNGALVNGGSTIPSQTEDLNVDAGANGGYGLKNINSTETSLGPLQDGSTYITANSTSVGAMSTTNTLIYFTDILSTNQGQINGGRGGIEVKARSIPADSSGSYSDIITFTMLANP